MAKQTFTTGQVLTAAQVNALQTNDFNQTVSAKTASYVLVAADKGTRIEFNTSGSVTCTVNTGLFDAGDTVYIQNTGAGVVTITAGTATVNTSATLAVNQYEGGVLYFVSASSAIWFEYASTANGDITGVTAGTGISGGGTSGDVTITNTMATAIDAKGDLVAGTADNTFARLAVGNNGETLVADSSTATGLKWAAAAGGGINPNAVVNGGFDIWQRGTSFTALSKTFTADRWWKFRGGDATGGTWSRQNSAVSAPGTQYCMRIQRDSGNTSTATMQLYSDFETSNSIIYAGQQITLSFYARKGANYSGGDFNVTLQTGTGTDQSQFTGFTSETTVLTVTATSASMNTSTFVRYSGTVTLASTVTQLGLKAIWTPTGTAGAADFVEITGIKLEKSSSATDFIRNGGTLEGELAACQRYYYLVVTNDSRGLIGGGQYNGATVVDALVPFPTTMRAEPTLVSTSGTNYYIFRANATDDAFDALTIMGEVTTNNGGVYTTSGVSGTSGHAGNLYTGNTAASVAFSAEL